MRDTLQWAIHGKSFEDGSLLRDWVKIEDSGVWHWQYDTHELSFSIYRHDGQYWKLYQVRHVPDGAAHYAYGFGGQACRMALVAYRAMARSPHSHRLMREDEREWVRTYEVDLAIHRVLQAGRDDPNYGAPYGSKKAA
ncbi:MAG: hypothetical protein AAF637_22630 [Pseudomonadota bacterium]